MPTQVRVNTQTGIRVSINNQARKTIRTVGVSALADTGQLSGLLDVDASDPNNNETLVYDSNRQKYVIKTLPVLDGGTY